MDALVEEKLAKEESVVNLLENKVVLIKTKDTETRVTGFENITEAENLALAGEDVPVGQYAREIFTNLDIMDQVEAMEINEGKNVTEVLAAVTQGKQRGRGCICNRCSFRGRSGRNHCRGFIRHA